MAPALWWWAASKPKEANHQHLCQWTSLMRWWIPSRTDFHERQGKEGLTWSASKTGWCGLWPHIRRYCKWSGSLGIGWTTGPYPQQPKGHWCLGASSALASALWYGQSWWERPGGDWLQSVRWWRDKRPRRNAERSSSAGGWNPGSRGGIHGVRILCQRHAHKEDWGFLLIDVRNAFIE